MEKGCTIESTYWWFRMTEKQFSEQMIADKIRSIRDIIKSLPLLNHPHAEFAVLCSCFLLPKTTYLLPTTDLAIFSVLWITFDSIIFYSLTMTEVTI